MTVDTTYALVTSDVAGGTRPARARNCVVAGRPTPAGSSDWVGGWPTIAPAEGTPRGGAGGAADACWQQRLARCLADDRRRRSDTLGRRGAGGRARRDVAEHDVVVTDAGTGDGVAVRLLHDERGIREHGRPELDLTDGRVI